MNSMPLLQAKVADTLKVKPTMETLESLSSEYGELGATVPDMQAVNRCCSPERCAVHDLYILAALPAPCFAMNASGKQSNP